MENQAFDIEAFRKEAITKLQAGEGLLGEGFTLNAPIKYGKQIFLTCR